MLALHMARDESGLSAARIKDKMCLLRLITSAIPDAVILAGHHNAKKGKTLQI